MIRGVWSRETVAWIIVAALVPVAAAALLEQGLAALLRIALGLAVVGFWQMLFREVQGVPLCPAGAVTAVAIAVLAPRDLPVWQVMIAVSFGTVIGELVFGGWGRNFLSGATATLAFLYLSVPGAAYEPAGPVLALAALPAALLLLLTGILSLPVLLAALAGFAAGAAMGVQINLATDAGSLAFALVFLVGDPVASAATRQGRWVYGAAAGGLTALLFTGTANPAQAAVFAALLASVFAPLIDQGAIAAQRSMRRARHG